MPLQVAKAALLFSEDETISNPLREPKSTLKLQVVVRAPLLGGFCRTRTSCKLAEETVEGRTWVGYGLRQVKQELGFSILLTLESDRRGINGLVMMAQIAWHPSQKTAIAMLLGNFCTQSSVKFQPTGISRIRSPSKIGTVIVGGNAS